MPQYELSLRDYLRIIRKRKLVILSSVVIFAALAAFYASTRSPVYEAETTVKIEERKTIAGLLTEWIMYNPGNIMESQAKIIKGFPVVKQAALRLGLITEATDDGVVSDIVRALQAKIETERIGYTNIIKIIVKTGNPEQARDIANTVAETYMHENLEEKRKQARKAKEFIEEQLTSIENRLRNSENKLKELRRQADNVEIAEDLQKKLVDLQFELRALLQKYTEKHPRVLQVRDQIKEMEKQLDGFSGQEMEYARLLRKIEANKTTYATLTQKLAEVKIQEEAKVADVSVVDPAGLPQASVGFQSRMPVVLVLGSFMGLLIGMILAFVAENLDTSIGTIDDVEKVAQLPVLGVAPSIPVGGRSTTRFLRNFRRRFLHHRDSHEDERKVRLVSHYEPASPIAEMFRNIKTNIKFSPTLKSILITSAGPQEGKTTIATNLGLVCAQAGLKVVLVSLDLRRPSLAETFGLDRKPGIGDILMGTATVSDALRNVSDMILGKMEIEDALKHPGLERLWILPAGTLPDNPTEMLNTAELQNLIEGLKKQFDVVLLDSPPVLPVADASVLATRVDAVVFCYEVGRTSRDALVRAKVQLESAKANILGIVLNHTEPETHLTGAYPYYYRYRYYGRDKEETAQPSGLG